jgi:eukaryotic-like serine/threonine-protein kinase
MTSTDSDASSVNTGLRPAALLAGRSLPGGWTVLNRLPRGPDSSGGNFSIPYVVERTAHARTEMGFLKALDLTVASSLPMPMIDALGYLSQAYLFERNLVMRCSASRMKNVVVGVEADQVRVDHPNVAPILVEVPYIIFERADGDIRTLMGSMSSTFDEAWMFRTLHGVANGLRQLHQADISHQDVKPSNIMSFGHLAKLVLSRVDHCDLRDS